MAEEKFQPKLLFTWEGGTKYRMIATSSKGHYALESLSRDSLGGEKWEHGSGIDIDLLQRISLGVISLVDTKELEDLQECVKDLQEQVSEECYGDDKAVDTMHYLTKVLAPQECPALTTVTCLRDPSIDCIRNWAKDCIHDGIVEITAAPPPILVAIMNDRTRFTDKEILQKEALDRIAKKQELDEDDSTFCGVEYFGDLRITCTKIAGHSGCHSATSDSEDVIEWNMDTTYRHGYE